MRRFAGGALAGVLLAAAVGVAAQSGASVARTFAAPVDKVWPVLETTLKNFGWQIEVQDRGAGVVVTDSRGVDFKNYGVYGDGTRHNLRLSVKPAEDDGHTVVTVVRELYREERILWMINRKAVETSDRTVETAVLDGIQATIPVVAPVAAPPAPGPPPVAAPTPAPPATAARPGSSRGEFNFKVTYRVKGTAGSVALTYKNALGGTEQSSVRLPWEVSFDAKGGSFLYVSAQNQGVSGSVTCEILLDDETRTTSTSNGAYVVAECSNAAERN